MQFGSTDVTEASVADREAILLMLSYVEAECRRLGAVTAAHHAAMAAAAIPPLQTRQQRELTRKAN